MVDGDVIKGEPQTCATTTAETARGSRTCLSSLLLAPKLLYLAVSLVYYTVYLYRPNFMKSVLRLGDRQYGDICALMALVGCFAGTLWGSIGDTLGRHRLVLLVLCGGVVISFEGALWVRLVEGESLRFYLSCAVLACYSFFASGLFPLTDYLVLKMLSRSSTGSASKGKDLYSRQVLFGTIGYGLVCLIVGYSIEWYTATALFYLLPMAAFLALLAILTLAPPDDDPKPLMRKWWRRAGEDDLIQGRASETTQSGGLRVGWRQHPATRLLTNASFMFMLLVVFLTGSARAVMTTFISKYWGEYMQLGATQVAIAANFGILLELLIFGLGPIFLRLFGVYWMLLLAQVAMVVRAWAYVLLPSSSPAIYVYLIELLKGVGFGLTQISGTKVASEEAPEELQATAQALYTTFYSILPLVATSWAGGRCYEAWGPATLFWVTASVVTMALMLCTIKYLFDGSISLCGIPIARKTTIPTLTV